MLYCIVLYCIALHCIALHFIVLYCIVLYWALEGAEIDWDMRFFHRKRSKRHFNGWISISCACTIFINEPSARLRKCFQEF